MKRDIKIGGYPIGDCPRCGNPIHIWFQQGKLSGNKRGVKTHVSHTGTDSNRCHGKEKSKP